jgi:hypothetical protein
VQQALDCGQVLLMLGLDSGCSEYPMARAVLYILRTLQPLVIVTTSHLSIPILQDWKLRQDKVKSHLHSERISSQRLLSDLGPREVLPLQRPQLRSE